jgi:hypothetical protein
MSDKDIDFSDCPEITPEMFAKAVVRKGMKPAPLTYEKGTIRCSSVFSGFRIREQHVTRFDCAYTQTSIKPLRMNLFAVECGE